MYTVFQLVLVFTIFGLLFWVGDDCIFSLRKHTAKVNSQYYSIYSCFLYVLNWISFCGHLENKDERKLYILIDDMYVQVEAIYSPK